MSIHKGNIAELQFLLLATQRGLVVSRPSIQSTIYDFLVDNSKRILRIQVKSNFGDPDSSGSGYGLNLSNNAGAYSPDDIDIVACYLGKLGIWYFFPIKALDEKLKITVYPDGTESKWNKYMESWRVLF